MCGRPPPPPSPAAKATLPPSSSDSSPSSAASRDVLPAEAQQQTAVAAEANRQRRGSGPSVLRPAHPSRRCRRPWSAAPPQCRARGLAVRKGRGSLQLQPQGLVGRQAAAHGRRVRGARGRCSGVWLRAATLRQPRRHQIPEEGDTRVGFNNPEHQPNTSAPSAPGTWRAGGQSAPLAARGWRENPRCACPRLHQPRSS